MEKRILEEPETIRNLPRDGHILANNGEVQARSIEVHKAYHEIRLFGHKGHNEFASHIELNYIRAEKQFAEHMVYIQAGGIDETIEHARLLEKALYNLNCFLILRSEAGKST